MAEFTSGRRVLILLVGSILASIFIICFLNWEAHRRYDEHHRHQHEGESVTIIKEQKEIKENSSTTIITVIRAKMSHFISSIKTKLRRKLLYLLKEEEKEEVKENQEAPLETSIPKRIGRQLKSISEKNEHHFEKTKKEHSHGHAHLERHLLHNQLHNQTTRHLSAKIHRLKKDSPLVEGILKHFGHKCYHRYHGHHTRNHSHHHLKEHHHHSNHHNDIQLYVGIKSHFKRTNSSRRHLIPQASSEDVTHNRSSIPQGHNVCGSTADVILIIISTTLINWTILIIVLVIRAIFLQRDLLCTNVEEDTLPIATCDDQYRRLCEDSNDSIIIKPSTRNA